MTWAWIKPGTWNIPEHAGRFRNMPEHEKIKIIFKKKKFKNSKYIKMGREEGGFQAFLTQPPLVNVCHAV